MASRKVLVTGASRGLGRSLAVAFAAEGAEVVGTGRDLPELERTAQLCRGLAGTFGPRELDVCDAAAADDLIAGFSPLDVCVVNAGIAEQKPAVDTGAEDLRRMLEVNTVGAFAAMRAAAAAMLPQGRGRIVAIASDAAYKPIPTMASYVGSKHALLGIARTLAAELAGTGVHVTTVCPGGIRTTILGPGSLGFGMDPDEVAAAVVAHVAAGPSIGSTELHLQPRDVFE